MRAAALAVLFLATACGGSAPTGPTRALPAGHIELETGPQWLDLLGFGLSDDPDYPACIPPFVPRDGTNVTTRVELAREGSDWIARSSESATGDLTIRFREAGQSLLGRTVTGTIRGWAVNVPRFSFELARDVRTAVAGFSGTGSAVLEGTVPPRVSFVLGSVSGEIRFSDRAMTAWSTCSKIQFSLQPVIGISGSAGS